MTSKEILAAEASNYHHIVLYSEGLFWKAYERSAYALYSQIKQFKPQRKILKNLGGGDIVSVGFLRESEQKYMGGLRKVEQEDKTVRYESVLPFAEEDFIAWKNSVPLTEKAAAPKSSVLESAELQYCAPASNSTEENDAVWKSIKEKIIALDLIKTTPAKAMQFLLEIKEAIM